MKILLFGKNGQVGWELQRSLAPLGNLVSLDRKGENGLCGDLSDLEGIRNSIQKISPDIIVNAAAYTAVDQAESESDHAMRINAFAPQAIAEETKKINALLIHYSTDYVFNGTGNNFWKEPDETDPVNTYGKSKLEGEKRIAESGCRHLIFRTSWVYGLHGANFIKKILQLGKEREKLTVINDQFGAPTGAELLSDITAHCIRSMKDNAAGIFHLVPAGETTWYDLARFSIDTARNLGLELAVKEILPVASSEFKTMAERPHNSRMDTKKLQNTFSLNLPDWRNGVTRLISELTGK
jgi:dTDP-4-dehydrorhamnose reductase